MNLLNKCPVCGAALSIEKVEKLLRGGQNMAAITVEAGVCHKCGEMVFDADTVDRLERLRAKLNRNDVSDLTPMGNAYSA